jgi:hypothetical protein
VEDIKKENPKETTVGLENKYWKWSKGISFF